MDTSKRDRGRHKAANLRQPTEAPLRVVSWWWAVAIVVMVVTGGALAMWLLGVWRPVSPGSKDLDQLRLERIKAALTVAAGLAAGATLLMTFRRQMLSERTQRFAEREALEQRSTALYTAAVDQLGSDKAAVRLAGLYGLERLGRHDLQLRQTVVDVWCSYLRMPYMPAGVVLWRDASGSSDSPGDDGRETDIAIEAERRQELQVRLTAQRLLQAHLAITPVVEDAVDLPEAYWLDAKGKRLSVDLTGAILVDIDFEGLVIGSASFTGAQFCGDTYLAGARFGGVVKLDQAKFRGKVVLSNAEFDDTVNFRKTDFRGRVDMRKATFRGRVIMSEAQFRGEAYLRQARFQQSARFRESGFHDHAHLDGAEFHDVADFHNVIFGGDAYLNGVRFHSLVFLREAMFNGRLDLSAAAAPTHTMLPDGWVLSNDYDVTGQLLAVDRALSGQGSPSQAGGTRNLDEPT